MAQAATEVLCRLDQATQTPIVFITDTINGNQIDAWTRNGRQTMTLDFYHSTGSLSANDERVLAEAFAKANNRTNVRIRQRLPRTNRDLPNLLDSPATILNAPPVPTPTASGVVIVPKTKAKNGNGRKGKRRAGRAKPIEAQSVAQVQHNAQVEVSQPVASILNAPTQAPASIAQATPADVMAAIQALGQEFNGKLAQLASLLTPAQK